MFTQEKVDRIVSVLPHGNGVNFDYEIEQKGKKIYIRNAWDYMDEFGFYDDVFPFVVCYENGRFKYLHFAGCTRSQYRKIEYAGLRDYLETLKARHTALYGKMKLLVFLLMKAVQCAIVFVCSGMELPRHR